MAKRGKSAADVAAEVELKALRDRIDGWSEKYPELTKKAMMRGGAILRNEVRDQISNKLRQRTGDLYHSISHRVWRQPNGRVDMEVYPEGSLNAAKLRATEYGAYRQNPGQHPYIVINGRVRFISYAAARELEQRGFYTARTQPYTTRQPKRQVLAPALRKKKAEIVHQVLYEIIEGYKAEKAVANG